MNENEKANNDFGTWGILELMGHVRIAGYITEEEHFGSKLGRIDIPMPDGRKVTQFFGGSSVYRLTPCDEATARAVSVANQPEPVHRYELPATVGRVTDDMGYEEYQQQGQDRTYRHDLCYACEHSEVHHTKEGCDAIIDADSGQRCGCKEFDDIPF